jgi:hypothetical protein
MLVALPSDQVSLRIGDVWPRQLPACDGEFERGQVLALEESIDVRG